MALVYLPEVVTLQLDQKNCIGCGVCETVCPHGVLRLEKGRARIVARDRCMECGACGLNCPTAAVSVQASVGCARAVINAALGRRNSSCCCLEEPKAGDSRSNQAELK